MTYLFDGHITHRDSVGAIQEINPGEVNWMTAGSGITHSERFETLRAARRAACTASRPGCALPDGQEEIDPSFANHGPADLPTYEGGRHAGRGWWPARPSAPRRR